MSAAELPDDLKSAKPTRYPGRAYGRYRSNYGITNSAGEWMFTGENIAGFGTRKGAAEWIADPSRAQGQHRNWRALPANTQF